MRPAPTGQGWYKGGHLITLHDFYRADFFNLQHFIDRIGNFPSGLPQSNSHHEYDIPVMQFSPKSAACDRTDPNILYLMTDEKERETAGQPGPEDEPCEQCGLCCRIFGPGISPTAANVYLWMSRRTISARFVANMETPCRFPCRSLCNEFGMWSRRDAPSETVSITVCPFLRRVTKERYLCGIHAMKQRCAARTSHGSGAILLQPVPCLRKATGSAAGL